MSASEDAAGVPQPSNESELNNALSNAPDHSFVECQQTTFELGSTVTIPDTVDLDARGATFNINHSGTAIKIGDGSGGSNMPRDGNSTMYGGTINMGSSSAAAVLSEADGFTVWQCGPVGTTVNATPGSGTAGFFVSCPGGNRNFYQFPVIQTNGVDFPQRIEAIDGPSNEFVTSINPTVIASDFVDAVYVTGSINVRNVHCQVNLTPGSNSRTVVHIDNPESRLVTSEGTVGDESMYSRALVWFDGSSNMGQGMHTHMSLDGYSSVEDSSLVDDETGHNDSRVIDWSL